MVTAFIFGKMGINMKESGKLVSDMVTALTSLQMAMFILVNINWGNLMDMDNINGPMETLILECFRMD